MRTSASSTDAGSDTGPQFTEAAEDSIYIVLFYGTTSAAWEFAELDASDEDEPYLFSAASVTAAGPTNDSTLRTAINNDSTVFAMLVDGSHPNIDIGNLEIADPPEAPTAPTVTSTGMESLSVTIPADPISDSPITFRDLRYKATSEDDTLWALRLAIGSTETITQLDPNTEYEVQWRANMGSTVTGIAVTAGGSGYTSTPNVDITGGDGLDATATAVISGGAVTAITVNDHGRQYKSAPTVTISGGGGSGATATAEVFLVQRGAWSDSGTATTDGADLMPTIQAIGDIILNHGGTLNFTLPAPISGDPPVTLTLTGLASWMSFNANTRQLTGTAPNAQSSTTLTYTATDTDGDMATRTFSVRVLLGLADFDTSGLETEALALIQALREGTNSYVWSVDPHNQGNRGSLLDGEMTVDGTNIPLNAVRFRSGSDLGNTRISIEARDIPGFTGNLRNYFITTGGRGTDLTLHVQSSTLSFSFGVNSHNTRHGTDWIRWDLADADEQAVLASIANGERFLFALTRPFNAAPTVTIDTSGFTVEPNSVVNIRGTVADAEDDNGTLTVTAATTLGTITAPVNTDGTWTCALTAPAGAATTQDMVVTITVEDSGGKTATATETWTVRAAILPGQPAPPLLVSNTSSSLTATWVAPTTGDPPTSYDIQSRNTHSLDPTFRVELGVTSPHDILGLNGGFLHEVQVRGVNAAGNGPWSTSTIERVQYPTLILDPVPDVNLTFGQDLDVQMPNTRGGFGIRTHTLTPLASWMSFDPDGTQRRLTGTAPGTPSTTTLTYTVTDESVPVQSVSRTFDVNVAAPPATDVTAAHTLQNVTAAAAVESILFQDVTAAHTLQNVSAAAAVEQDIPTVPPTDVSASHTLQNVMAAAAVEQDAPAFADVTAAHTLQNVTAAAAVEQVAVADTDVSVTHTLQNVSAAAVVEQFTPAARDIVAAHTLQNVIASAVVQQRAGVALAGIPDQDARQGEAYTFCVPDATGGDEPFTYTATGLPTGTVIHGPTGLIYGVPSVEQTATVTVTVTDANGNTDSQSFDISVAPKPRNTPLSDAGVTSDTPGVLVKGTVNPRNDGTSIVVVEADMAAARISDRIDREYIENEELAYWTQFSLTTSGGMTLFLGRDPEAEDVIEGPLFTGAAAGDIYIVLFYGSTSAVWEFGLLEPVADSPFDGREPYVFTSTSVAAAGPINNAALRNAVNADSTVIAMLVDGDHSDVDIDNLLIADPTVTPGPPTVDITTPAQTIFIGDQIKITADVGRVDLDDLTFAYTVSPRRGTFLPSYGKDTVWTAPQIRDDYVITQTVTDEDGNVVTDSVTITVAGVNFVEVDDIGVEVGDSHTSTLPVATDGNGPYTYAVTNLPAGATFDDTTRQLAWTPNAPGGRMVTYTATDTDTGHTFSRSFLLMAHLPGLASYVVLVDWDDDRQFAHANADIFPDVDRGSAMRVRRGRNYASSVYGRSITGTLETRLLNYHGRYDRDSTTSPLAGLIVPRRRIVWAAAAGGAVYRLWEGFLSTVDKIDKTGGDDMAKLSGYDIIGLLTRDDDASIPYVASTTTGAAADAIVEAGEVDADDLGEFEGSTVLTHFYQRRSSSWRQLQAVEEAEGGFLNVSGRGRLSMDARDARATRARSTTVQLTLTDSQTPGAGEVGILPGPKFRDPLKDLANLVRARVRTWTVSDEVDLWELDEELVLGPGDSITLRPQYMARETSPAVTEWIDPQPCTDFQAWSMTGGAGDELTGTLDVDLVAGATEAELTLTNEHATATLYVSLLKLRGKRLEEGDPVEVEVRDDASIAAYGPRPYTIATDLLSTVMDAKDYADDIIDLYAMPTRKGTVMIQANPIFADALPLELSDRVNLTLRGADTDMYIEAIGHALTPGLRHDMQLTLSQVP